jgi:signal transduction histidine kinase/sensor domain CHASE-containing protein
MLKISIGLMVAIAYVITGKLGMLLSPGDGYSTAMFPPAGIAMAAVLIYGRSMLPWVFLGALALNSSLTDALRPGMQLWLASSVGISLFSALQAGAGVFLLRRWLSMPLVFENGKEAVHFVLTALLSCLISSTLSTTLLYALHLVADGDIRFVWLTWWLGDSLGVILMLPMSLLLIGEPKKLWHSRRNLMSAVIGCGLLLIVIIVKQVNQWEREESLTEFRLYSQQIGDQIKSKFAAQESYLDQLAIVMAGNNKISQLEFDRMAKNALKHFDFSVQAIEWAAQVPDSERAAFELIQREIHPSFAITERHDERLYPAAARSSYLPVTFVVPVEGNQAAFGFDLLSNDIRRNAIQLSGKLGVPVATAPITLVQERGAQQGLLLIRRVEQGANGPGLVLMAVRMDDFMSSILAGTKKQVSTSLADVDLQGVLTYNGFTEPVGANLIERTLTLGQRNYRLQTQPTAAYMASHRNWDSWLLLIGALGFMSVLSMSLLLASARTARIETLVRLRTQELEEARRNAERVSGLLQEHAEQLSAIFNLSPDGFVSFDADHCVKYISPAFYTLMGLMESDLIGLSEAEFSYRLARLCLPEAAFAGIAVLRARQASPLDGAADLQQKIQLAGAGQRVLEVDLRLSDAYSVSQILYLRDITHETEVDRMKGEFLATAAHELRTPMASIYGFAELMLALELSPADQREYLGTIFKQSELMVTIINELLDLARIEARRGKDFILARIKLGELLREIVMQFKTPDGRMSPEFQGEMVEISIRADRTKLTQTITNILSNAYKYSPDGGTVTIELLSEQKGAHRQMIAIRIRDQGIGMTPEQLARVFERFYRADVSGKIPGTGLGMNIVQEIVQLHGGEVHVDSTCGAGTTVTVWLPIETVEKSSGEGK